MTKLPETIDVPVARTTTLDLDHLRYAVFSQNSGRRVVYAIFDEFGAAEEYAKETICDPAIVDLETGETEYPTGELATEEDYTLLD